MARWEEQLYDRLKIKRVFLLVELEEAVTHALEEKIEKA